MNEDYEERASRAAEAAAEFIMESLNTRRPLRDDWWDSLEDAVIDLQKIATAKLTNPDARASARTILHTLAGLWLDTDENEQRYIAVAWPDGEPRG